MKIPDLSRSEDKGPFLDFPEILTHFYRPSSTLTDKQLRTTLRKVCWAAETRTQQRRLQTTNAQLRMWSKWWALLSLDLTQNEGSRYWSTRTGYILPTLCNTTPTGLNISVSLHKTSHGCVQDGSCRGSGGAQYGSGWVTVTYRAFNIPSVLLNHTCLFLPSLASLCYNFDTTETKWGLCKDESVLPRSTTFLSPCHRILRCGRRWRYLHCSAFIMKNVVLWFSCQKEETNDHCHEEQTSNQTFHTRPV